MTTLYLLTCRTTRSYNIPCYSPYDDKKPASDLEHQSYDGLGVLGLSEIHWWYHLHLDIDANVPLWHSKWVQSGWLPIVIGFALCDFPLEYSAASGPHCLANTSQ